MSAEIDVQHHARIRQRTYEGLSGSAVRTLDAHDKRIMVQQSVDRLRMLQTVMRMKRVTEPGDTCLPSVEVPQKETSPVLHVQKEGYGP
ncbi:MAG: hypothetical protein KGO50_19445 [Myxococcales bacterium]|nr:hypothetical protein [Myxococcales bacterium]